jgi:hypothetical protein
MDEMGELLDLQAAKWKNLADQQLDLSAHVITLALGTQLDKLAEYAHGAAHIHGTGRLMSLNELMIRVFWQPLPGEQVPAELPHREQSEHN